MREDTQLFRNTVIVIAIFFAGFAMGNAIHQPTHTQVVYHTLYSMAYMAILLGATIKTKETANKVQQIKQKISRVTQRTPKVEVLKKKTKRQKAFEDDSPVAQHPMVKAFKEGKRLKDVK